MSCNSFLVKLVAWKKEFLKLQFSAPTFPHHASTATSIFVVLMKKTVCSSCSYVFWFSGAVVSLAWLAVGFHLSALNTKPVGMVESVARESQCSGHR